jgi:hypothetical protein
VSKGIRRARDIIIIEIQFKTRVNIITHYNLKKNYWFDKLKFRRLYLA